MGSTTTSTSSLHRISPPYTPPIHANFRCFLSYGESPIHVIIFVSILSSQLNSPKFRVAHAPPRHHRVKQDQMSLKIPNFYHQLPLSRQSRTQKKAWKRRKLKLKSTQTLTLTIRNHFNFNFFDSKPFENLFQSLISQFPSTNSLDLLAPALGLASGAAIFFSQSEENSKCMTIPDKKRNKFVGEWILFSSPTPFNRFVMLRCPSITFEGSELLEDVNEKLMKEDRHFVRLNRGKIQVRECEVEEVEKLVYQRVCVGTEDGGVLSLDWPANLDLEEERGLDTTVLIVPGTAEGSMERDIRNFVYECLRRGCFPVVMNPRGCAGSPLTTPRLFSAADSDDISTAILFIYNARPWTTIMGVGWGYGANMLTKYLAEVGEKTPLTAATCIDNPFDLEEATRSTPYHILLDQKLRSGLIDILRSNKELFQGRAKGFDVEKALLATSVRNFEKAISMVSYGFDEIEDFYAKSSTRDMVGKVKIPLLFIQNDNGTVPLFSTPRSLIAENPFTCLLLCSYLPSRENTSSRLTVSWCQNLTIEWLTAVELGLLKGRHPLLQDVDVSINPSKGIALVEGRASNKNGRVNKLFSVPNLDALDVHSLNPAKQMFVANIHSRSKEESNRIQPENKNLQEHTSAVDAELVGGEVMNSDDGERGQVLQTAEVVMNMLDMTMPEKLTEEQKKKSSGTMGTLSKPFENKVGHSKDPKNEDEMSDNTQNNIVTSLAEKAMLVASPVVPTKEDGEVDHERLVAMLAELGQKGGILKLVGKIALLWGGIRGALSLTNKLISFLRMAEWPLFQRIFGFVFMVLVLWSPVVVPLLPTLVKSWATHNSPGIAELACLIGLYVSIMLMVTLWGKRIRGYDNPLEQYGLDLTSPSKVQSFAKGLIGGIVLVLLIHYVNFVTGFIQPSWPTYLPLSSSDAITWVRVCGRILLLVFRGLATATGLAVVEELLFRSWLPDEISADFGYYRAIILAGLAFSLSQRSPWAIPGLWLLSLGLAGARQRSQGSLSLPIGLRAGILVSSFILQRGGFLTYHPSTSIWLCGSRPFDPFSGIVGLIFSLSFAIIFYPGESLLGKKVTRTVRD